MQAWEDQHRGDRLNDWRERWKQKWRDEHPQPAEPPRQVIAGWDGTASPPPGLGVNRHALMRAFPEVAFHEGRPSRSGPKAIGGTDSPSLVVELDGPPQNLTNITVAMVTPYPGSFLLDRAMEPFTRRESSAGSAAARCPRPGGAPCRPW
jgi:hypothetical protein